MAQVKDLEKALSGEYSAIQCYARLAESAPNQAEKDRILEIRKDEERHYRQFAALYTSLTGREPAPQLEACPANHREGLLFAFRDEQETVDFYNEAADRAQTPAVKDAFRRAALDEQNHAVWFLSFLTLPAMADGKKR
nr:ferritin-like domain-containing protein [Paenibacillus sp. J31TS4]